MTADRSKKRLSVALNNPRPVGPSFDAYKRAAKEAGFELVGVDNEGFEAEIYLKTGRDLASVTIRSSASR